MPDRLLSVAERHRLIDQVTAAPSWCSPLEKVVHVRDAGECLFASFAGAIGQSTKRCVRSGASSGSLVDAANEDGSSTIHPQPESPGPGREPNWPPAPGQGIWFIGLRLYLPRPEGHRCTMEYLPINRLG
ncbi:DUF1214 domain-containing protein [Streptomyces sp. NPDC058964]|uniref:DUF1214 domain-containing protein n=1 Tax=Streptomyces sp. NPDC058964 TaxID=3346681 RepID=UPI0036B99FF9